MSDSNFDYENELIKSRSKTTRRVFQDFKDGVYVTRGFQILLEKIVDEIERISDKVKELEK